MEKKKRFTTDVIIIYFPKDLWDAARLCNTTPVIWKMTEPFPLFFFCACVGVFFFPVCIFLMCFAPEHDTFFFFLMFLPSCMLFDVKTLWTSQVFLLKFMYVCLSARACASVKVITCKFC